MAAQNSTKCKDRSVPSISGQQEKARVTDLVPTGVEKERQEMTGAASYVGFCRPPKGD